MSKLYYFQKDNEYCYSLDYYRSYMKENDIKEMVVFRAKMLTREPYYFCKFFGEVGEVGEGCGKQCSEYIPRNGKNGRCTYSKNCYAPTDEFIILTNKQKKDENKG